MNKQPKTDADLFDMLHSLLGFGNLKDGEPWFRFRLREIGKLKSIRKGRGITLDEMAQAARYCVRHRLSVQESWQLRGFLADAKREARLLAVPELSKEVSAALEQERALPGPDSAAWIERLLLTRGLFRREVLDEWRRTRND